MKQEEKTCNKPEPFRPPRQRQVQSASFTKGVLEQPHFVQNLSQSQGKPKIDKKLTICKFI